MTDLQYNKRRLDQHLCAARPGLFHAGALLKYHLTRLYQPGLLRNAASGRRGGKGREAVPMKYVGKKGLSGAIEVALDVLMLVALVLLVSLPWSVEIVTEKVPGAPGMWYEKYLVVLIFSGILAELVLWQARGIMHNVNNGRSFTYDTVRRLRVIGVECLVLALFYFIAVFVVTKFFMVVVFVCFSVVGLILFVFAELFRQATKYKEENDMTI